MGVRLFLMDESRYCERTLEAYSVYADRAIANWSRIRTPRFLKAFARALPENARILDYGCGIGTELAWLARRGFSVDAIDAAPAFVREARKRAPDAHLRLARFEDAVLPSQSYDGIWCNAALIHVPPAELRLQLGKLRSALKPDGLLGLTLAWGRSRGFTIGDWIPGRYFAAYSKKEVEGFLSSWLLLSLHVANGDGRAGRWIQALCRKG